MQLSYSSIPEMVLSQAKRYGEKPVMRAKRNGTWERITWNGLIESARNTALGLASLGLKEGDRVSILSENRPEWAVADLGTLFAGGFDAPIYTTNTPEQCAYIVRDCGARFIFVSTGLLLAKILEKLDTMPTLEKIICFDSPESRGNEKIMTLENLQEIGKAFTDKSVIEGRIARIKPDDLLTLIYTSGTTGEPKGVMLTHGNMISNCQASASILPISDTDSFMSFLPLSHSFERMAGYYMALFTGAEIIYAESIEKLVDNLAETHPTLLCSVPRIFEKVYNGFMQQAEKAQGLKKKILSWALKVGSEASEKTLKKEDFGFALTFQRNLAHKLVFSKLHAKLGGNIRFLVSGGAPLSAEIARFFHAAGLLVLEGYGLTETSPVIAVNRPDKYRFGTVGMTIPDVEVKIAGDGEILVKGPNVMKGYYNKPDATKEVFTADGYFMTGDIGELSKDDLLKITDRKKDLIKTAGGKYVAPQAIENRLKLFPMVEQVNVIGDMRPFCTALIVPNFMELEKWAADRGFNAKSQEELIANGEVQKHYEGIRAKLNEELAPFEQIKKIRLIAEPFSQENNMLTPTLKVRRKIVNLRYEKLIGEMYE